MGSRRTLRRDLAPYSNNTEPSRITKPPTRIELRTLTFIDGPAQPHVHLYFYQTYCVNDSKRSRILHERKKISFNTIAIFIVKIWNYYSSSCNRHGS